MSTGLILNADVPGRQQGPMGISVVSYIPNLWMGFSGQTFSRLALSLRLGCNIRIRKKHSCSMSHSSPGGRGIWGRMDTCICMAEPLLFSPETITTLLIGYTPKQNKKFKIKKKRITVRKHVLDAQSLANIAVCLASWITVSSLLYVWNGLVAFPTFFNLSLNLAIRSSWSELQSAPGHVFADCIELLHLWLQRI